MKKYASYLAVFIVSAVLLACGSSNQHHTYTSPINPPNTGMVTVCSGLTDTCHTISAAALKNRIGVSPYPGCKVSDVSDYQHVVNWALAKKAICGAIAKGGEGGSYAGGNQFVANWNGLRAAHIWHAMYWFVRANAGCSQANLMVTRLRFVGYANDKLAGPVQYDEETPGSNLAGCLDHIIYQAFHRHGEVYTGPGTNPGETDHALPLWQAEYGPVLHPVWNPVNLWQCTDGVYGCVTYVPGIGYDDVSVNRGLIQNAPAPPRVHCFGNHAAIHNPNCVRDRKQVAKWNRAVVSSEKAYRVRGCVILAQRVQWFGNAIHKHPRSSKTPARRRALAASRTAYRQRSCSLFASRAGLYKSFISRIEKKVY